MSLITTILSLYGVGTPGGAADAAKHNEAGAALSASLSNPAKLPVPVLDPETDGADNDDEQSWLEEHIDLLVMGPTDRARQRRGLVMDLIRKIPKSIKMAMFAFTCLVLLVLLPPFFIAGYRLVQSKVAIAKVALTVFFAMLAVVGYKLMGV